MKDKAKRIAGRFTAIAREGGIEKAVEYYEREAVFDDIEIPAPTESRERRTPPMNELYKGLKD